MEGAEGPREGWYDDPHDPGRLRWWDGGAWSEHTHPKETAPAAAEEAAAPAAAEDAAQTPSPAALPTHTPEEALALADALMPIPASPGESPSSSGRPYGRLPWVIGLAALVLVAGMIVLIAGVGGGGAGDEDADEDAKAAARGAQAAVETYAAERGGSYAGVTVEQLAALDPVVADAEITLDGQDDGYTLSVMSESGTSFGLSRAADGTTTYSCTDPGSGGCPASGNWAELP